MESDTDTKQPSPAPAGETGARGAVPDGGASSQGRACIPGSIAGKAALVAGHLYGAALMRALTLRHRWFVRNARPLAAHLEAEVFRRLREDRVAWLELRVEETVDGGRQLVGTADDRSFRFPGAHALVEFMGRAGLEAIRLDTQLESGQIVEALIALLYVRSRLDSAAPGEPGYTAWAKARVAGAMLGAEGYHKFCAEMRFYPEERRYDVHYSYCELLFSRVITTYVEHRPRFGDHRVLFRTAPRAALAALLVFSVPAVLILWNLYAAAVAVVALGVLAALLTGLGIHTLGAVQYTREHHDLLLKEYYDRIGILSRFPEANPNLVVKLGERGQVVYTNPATRRFLRRVGVDEAACERILPDDLPGLVAECLSDASSSHEAEVRRFGRHLRFTLTAFPDERAVIAAGSDVTYLRKVEQELRVLNQGLERLVEERTHELRETQDVTILSLAGLAETRDPETGQHLQRTREYVRVLAEALRSHPRFEDVLDDQVIEHLYKSVPLHDIGKVGVPDAILRKPGPLTDEEREIMRQHTVFGGDALRSAEERLGFDSFLGVARDIAYHHHERWDGAGYPNGLKGDAIPWPARLMALADVYDALMSARYYKEAFGHPKTRALILQERGAHFDPDVVDAFLAREEEFEAIAARFADEQAVEAG